MANKPWQLPRTSVEDGCGVYGQEERELFPSQASSLLHNRTPGALMILLPIVQPAPGPATTGKREKPTMGRKEQQVAKEEEK